ncbi:hypothetical protein [Streptomyces sp. NPDC000878]
MTRTSGLAIALVLVAVMTAVAGCGGPAPARSPSAGGSAPHPVVSLSADSRVLVPGGPPLAFRVAVAGLTAGQAGRRQLTLYIDTVPDRLQIREAGSWHDVALQWSNEQDDNGEFVAVVPLSHRGEARTEIEFRLFTADQQIDYVDGQVPAVRNTIAAQTDQEGRIPAAHAAASAVRMDLSVDATHLTIEVPQLLRATAGGPAVEWEVRVRNAAGGLTRSGLRVAISLLPGSADESVRQLHWSIDRRGWWTDLMGRTHIETEVFTLKPGASRTVRIRLALPAGTTAKGSDQVGAMLAAAVTAPWWPSDPDRPSGVSLDAESTNVLTEP